MLILVRQTMSVSVDDYKWRTRIGCRPFSVLLRPGLMFYVQRCTSLTVGRHKNTMNMMNKDVLYCSHGFNFTSSCAGALAYSCLHKRLAVQLVQCRTVYPRAVSARATK